MFVPCLRIQQFHQAETDISEKTLSTTTVDAGPAAHRLVAMEAEQTNS